MTAKQKKEKISMEDIAVATVKAESLAKDLTGKSLDELVTKTVEQFKPEAEKIFEKHVKDLEVNDMVLPRDPWSRKLKDYPESEVLSRDLKKRDIASLQTPFVVIDGMSFSPVGQHVAKGHPKTNNANSQWRFGDSELDINYNANIEEDIHFTVFNVKIGKQNTLILLDDKSSFVYTTGLHNKTYAEGKNPSHTPKLGRGVIKLINSSSVNDTFKHPMVTLTNTDSSENHFEGTSLVFRNQGASLGKYYGEYQGSPRVDYLAYRDEDSLNERMLVNRLNIINTTIIDCKLIFKEKSTGTIVDSILTNVTLDGAAIYNSHIIKNVTFRNVALRGKHLTASHTAARDLTIDVEENINLGRYSLNGKEYRLKGFYAPNKFNSLEIDTPEYLPYSLQVIDYNTVSVGYGQGVSSFVNFKLSADFETVKAAVKESIEKWTRMTIEDGVNINFNSQINASVFKYMVDSVWSRVKIINLIEGAQRLTDSVGNNPSGRY